MTWIAFQQHFIFAISLFVLSIGLSWFMMARVRIMDHPNQRSSHAMAMPKSGGIGIVVTFLVGAILIFILGDKTQIRQEYFIGFVASAVAIAAVSLYDDIKNKTFIVKLATQLMAIGVILATGIVLDKITLPWLGLVQLGFAGYVITAVWVLGMTNAFNFMDGLDGLAAGVAVITSLFFAIITFALGSTFVYITCYTILAGALGFLLLNFPPARIFMGDVGSAFLGFVFAALAIIASRFDHSQTSFLVIPLLLFGFIYDTSFTFIRRLLAGEDVTKPHRTHLYQLCHRLGYDQRAICLFHYLLCIAQGLAAMSLVQMTGGARLFIFLPFLLFYACYSSIVIARAKQAGLLSSR